MTDGPVIDHHRRISLDQITSHAQVYSVFRNLIEDPDSVYKKPRGNTYFHEHDLVAFSNSNQHYGVSAHNKRLSRFNEEQESYIDKCRVILRDTITSPTTGIVRQFERYWQETSDTAIQFEEVLCSVLLESLNEAFNKNAKLIPAFYGFLGSGPGAEGIQIAVSEALFPRSIDGTALADNYRAFISVDLSNVSHGNVVAETQCAAPALAMKIIDEVQKCMQIAGVTTEDMKDKQFSGPTYTIKHQIIDILSRRMNELGYGKP